MTTPSTSFPQPGPDLHTTLLLTWDEAQQGGVKSVSVNGNLEEVKFPAGATNGRELRLPGRGGPSLSGGPSGALIVTLQVPPAPERGGDIRRTLRVTWEEAQRGVAKPLTVDGQTLDVPVPAGATDGHTIRWAGAGSPGRNGAPPGDLILTLQVTPEPSRGVTPPAITRSTQFQETPAGTTPPVSTPPGFPSQVPYNAPQPPSNPPFDPYQMPQGPQRGEDVRVDLPLTAAQALAGGPHGVIVNGQRVEVPVPSGSADGSELRRAGAGLPGKNGGQPGDFIVTVRVSTPSFVQPTPMPFPQPSPQPFPQPSPTPFPQPINRQPASQPLPRWVVPVAAVAAVIVLALIGVHFLHNRPGPSPGPTPSPQASTLDYSQMQYWKTLPPPGGAANPQNPDSAYAMAFTSDDNLAVGYYPNTETSAPQLLLWDIPNTTSSSPGSMGSTTWLNVHDLAVSPNGQDLAVGGYDYRGSQRILAIYTVQGDLVKYYAVGPEVAASITGIAYSPNGRYLAVSSGDTRNKPGLKTFTPGGKPAVNGNITLWDASGASNSYTQSCNGNDAWCVSFTPDSLAMTYGETETVYQYPLKSDGTIAQQHPDVITDKQDGTVAFVSVVHSADGQNLYVILRTNAGADGLQDINAKTGAIVTQFLDKTNTFAYTAVQKIALSPDGRCLAACGLDNHSHIMVTLWDTQAGTLIGQPLPAHDDNAFTVAFSPDGRTLACGSNDGTVKLWHIP